MPKKCPSCGSQMMLTDTVCPQCGAEAPKAGELLEALYEPRERGAFEQIVLALAAVAIGMCWWIITVPAVVDSGSTLEIVSHVLIFPLGLLYLLAMFFVFRRVREM